MPMPMSQCAFECTFSPRCSPGCPATSLRDPAPSAIHRLDHVLYQDPVVQHTAGNVIEEVPQALVLALAPQLPQTLALAPEVPQAQALDPEVPWDLAVALAQMPQAQAVALAHFLVRRALGTERPPACVHV
jgi:hypothetical protein